MDPYCSKMKYISKISKLLTLKVFHINSRVRSFENHTFYHSHSLTRQNKYNSRILPGGTCQSKIHSQFTMYTYFSGIE